MVTTKEDANLTLHVEW